MDKPLEDRVRDLEAKLDALISFVLSDIATTDEGGSRSISDLLEAVDREMGVAARTSNPKAALFLDDLAVSIRATFDLPDPAASAED